MTDIGAYHHRELQGGTFALLHPDRPDLYGATLSAVFPLAAFGTATLLASQAGFIPSLPASSGAAGAVLFLVSLPFLGLSRWAAASRGAEGRSASYWVLGLTLALIAYPFLVGSIGQFGEALFTTAFFIIAIATSGRVVKVSRLAGLFLLPALLMSGIGALFGIISLSGGWTPPFAPTNEQAF